MTPTEPPTEGPAKRAGQRRGLLILCTGTGNGKTSAALGLVLRAHGRGLRTDLHQFIKHPDAQFGEHRPLDALHIPHAGLGDGFSWRSHDLEQSRDADRALIDLADTVTDMRNLKQAYEADIPAQRDIEH